MFRLLTFFLLLPVAMPAFAAEEIFNEHRFTVVLPSSESWMPGKLQPLGRDAEMIFNSVNMETREGILVTIIPKIPTNNVMNENVITRVREVLAQQGLTVTSNAPRHVKGVEFLELVGHRTDETDANLVAVSRASIRRNTVYIATFYGRGNDSLAGNAKFLRVLDTFRFMEDQKFSTSPLLDPMRDYYLVSYRACLGVAAMLALLFACTLFVTRKRAF